MLIYLLYYSLYITWDCTSLDSYGWAIQNLSYKTGLILEDRSHWNDWSVLLKKLKTAFSPSNSFLSVGLECSRREGWLADIDDAVFSAWICKFSAWICTLIFFYSRLISPAPKILSTGPSIDSGGIGMRNWVWGVSKVLKSYLPMGWDDLQNKVGGENKVKESSFWFRLDTQTFMNLVVKSVVLWGWTSCFHSLYYNAKGMANPSRLNKRLFKSMRSTESKTDPNQ